MTQKSKTWTYEKSNIDHPCIECGRSSVVHESGVGYFCINHSTFPGLKGDTYAAATTSGRST